MMRDVKTITPIGLGGLFAICLVLLGCASASNVVSEGNNTYSITRTASTGFFRKPAKLEAQAREEAIKFCESQGKVMKLISVTSGEPHWGGGMASAKIVFMALKEGDPALTAPPTPADTGAPGFERPAAAPTDVLFAELTKLNDLRQKGLLSEEEYQAQKRKILARSN